MEFRTKIRSHEGGKEKTIVLAIILRTKGLGLLLIMLSFHNLQYPLPSTSTVTPVQEPVSNSYVPIWSLKPEDRSFERPERPSSNQRDLSTSLLPRKEIPPRVNSPSRILHRDPPHLQMYTPHAPITISSNDQFASQGFPGAGTISDPYRIEGWEITSSTGPLISISDTTAYFRISGNVLNGLSQASDGINLSNVNHGAIENNLVYSNNGNGISIGGSNNNTIANNTVYWNNGNGIQVWDSSNNKIVNNSGYSNIGRSISIGPTSNRNLITNNTLHSNGEGIIIGESSNDNTIAYNSVYGINSEGIFVGDSNGNIIASNAIHDNSGDGCNLRASDNTIANNTIYSCQSGIGFSDSNNNHISKNTISNNSVGGISLWNSDNNRIANNAIFNNSWNGIGLGSSTHNSISNNLMYNSNFSGIDLGDSNHNSISNNTVYGCDHGIYLMHSNNSIISDNTVFNCTRAVAITLDHSNNALIDNNTAYNCGEGIASGGSYNIITSNTVYGNRFYGIWLGESNNNRIANNTVYECPTGIELVGSTSNIITKNYISNNSGSGIGLDADSEGNRVTLNRFTGNNPGGPQAHDDGFNNFVAYNYWADWTSPDANSDGLVDTPYSLAGSAMKNDLYPLAALDTHVLVPPVLLTPNGGEFFFLGTAIIQWIAAGDSLDHAITYALAYSADGGGTWLQLATGLTNTHYAWDIAVMPHGSNYLIKVEASDGQGLTADDTSEGSFTLQYTVHTLSTPTVVAPNGGEILNGTITIQWTAATDSWTPLLGHPVLYNISYSADGGVTWTSLATGLTTTSYAWNTTTAADGAYLIKVEAFDTYGLTAVNVSDQSFVIQNAAERDAVDIPPELIGVVLFVGFLVLLAGAMYYQQRKKPEPTLPARKVPTTSQPPTGEVVPLVPPTAPVEEEPGPAPSVPTVLSTPSAAVEVAPVVPPTAPAAEDIQSLFSGIQAQVQEMVVDQGESGPLVRLIPPAGLMRLVTVELSQHQILMSGQLDPQEIPFDMNLEITIAGTPSKRVTGDPWQNIIVSGEEDLIRTIKHREDLADKIAALETAVIKVDSPSPGVIGLQITCNKSKDAITRAYALIEDLQSFFDVSSI